MKPQSDDVRGRVNEGSFRLDREAGSFRLTGFRWRDVPELMLWLATSFVLLTGLNLAREAVFSKDLLGDDVAADLRQDFPDVQGMIENSEALIQAVRQNDPAAIQRCKEKLAELQEIERQRPVREAQRLAERAIAEKALRQRYGAAAAGLIAAGLVLSRVAQGYSARGHRKAAAATDAVDSR